MRQFVKNVKGLERCGETNERWLGQPSHERDGLLPPPKRRRAMGKPSLLEARESAEGPDNLTVQRLNDPARRSPVVILRRSSNFGGATFSGFYVNRDCPLHFHPDAAASAGGSQLDGRVFKQAVEAIPGRVQQSRAPGAGPKRDGAPAVPHSLDEGWCGAAPRSFWTR
jgi:hypothetical protein